MTEFSAARSAASFADRLRAEFEATVRRRTRYGVVRRLDERTVRVEERVPAGPNLPGDGPAAMPGAPLTVRVAAPDRLCLDVGQLGSASIGCAGPDEGARAEAAAVEAVEWLDAVLDGRVREVFVVNHDGGLGESRVSVAWRDGSRSRIATPGVVAAERDTHQRRHFRYSAYARPDGAESP